MNNNRRHIFRFILGQGLSTCAFIYVISSLSGINCEDRWIPAHHPVTAPHTLQSSTAPRTTMIVRSQVSGRVQSIQASERQILKASSADGKWSSLLHLKTALVENDLKIKELFIKDAEAIINIRKSEFNAALANQNSKQIVYDRYHKAGIEDNRMVESEAELVAAKAGYHTAQSAIKRAELQKSIFESEHDALRVHKSKHFIQGPAGWTVIDIPVEVGALIERGEAVATLADFSEIHITFKVTEEELAVIRSHPSLQIQCGHKQKPVPATYKYTHLLNAEKTQRRSVTLSVNPNNMQKVLGEVGDGIPAYLTLEVPMPQAGSRIPLTFIEKTNAGHFVHSTSGTKHLVTITAIDGDQATVLIQNYNRDLEITRPQ